MTPTAKTTALLADIGGTNTRVCLADDGLLRPATIRNYLNQDYDGLEPILRDYCEKAGNPPCNAACVDLAGPVSDGVGEMTNLKWVIATDMIRDVTGAKKVAVLNDLQAMGHAMGHIAAEDMVQVIEGQSREKAAQLVVNVGTGFNAVLVAETPGGRFVPAAEAGHVSLPVGNAEEWELAQHLVARHGHASVEEVLSGRGLAGLYGWLAGREGQRRPELDAQGVTAAFAEGKDPVAQQTVGLFLRILGRVTGDLALTHLPFGGIWFVGGVAGHLAKAMITPGPRDEFQHGFRDKGRFSEYMNNFQGAVVTDRYAALRGNLAYLDGQ